MKSPRTHTESETLEILPIEKADHFFERIQTYISTRRSYPEFMRLLRIILDELYTELCKDEPQMLDHLAKRQVFIAKKYIVPVHLNKEFHALRDQANKFHHTNQTSGPEKREAAIRAICLAVSYFSSQPIPAAIKKYYGGKQGLTLVAENFTPPEKINFDRVVVSGITIKYDGELVVLECESELGNGTYQLNLRDHSHEDKPAPYGQMFTEIGKLLWEFSTLHVFNISKHRKREGVYSTYFQSMIVVEPDYLIDATFLASCFYEDKYVNRLMIDPRLALIEKLSGIRPNRWMLQGALANDFLDHLLRDPDAEFEEVFRQSMGKQVWNVVNIGKRTILEIKNDLQTKHYATIAGFAKEMQGHELTIEPTFYSAKYGLQGRLDLLSKSKKNKKSRNIYELKSGRAPEDASQVSINHEMQVIAYNLLIDSTFGISELGNSGILYSKAEVSPVRRIEPFFQSGQKAIRARNELIAFLFSISSRDFRFYDFIKLAYFQPPPPFHNQRKLIEDFGEDLKRSSALVGAYFKEFSAFVLRELQTAKVGDINPREGKRQGFASLWHKDAAEKKAAFEILDNLKFEGKETPSLNGSGDHQIIKFRKPSNGFCNFRENDIAIIYPQDAGKLRPLSYQIHKCSIVKLEKDSITLRLRNTQADLSYFEKHETWALEHDFLERSYFSMLESLRLFLGAEPKKRDVFLGLAPPRFGLKHASSFEFDIMGFMLSNSQQEALKRALTAEDYMLIQGPPGTGKTSRVLLYMLLHLYRYTAESVVVLAFTNKAVDKIIDSIEAYNQSNKGHERVEYLHMAGAHRSSPNSLINISRGKTFNEVQAILGQSRIFIGTIAAFQSHQHLLPGHLDLDTLIIDEASQLVEPQVAGIIPRFKRFIMIGDHNQLPAVTVQRERLCKIENPELEEIGISDLRTSVFERLWKQVNKNAKVGKKEWPHAAYTLKEHFRMHNDIADLVNQNYNGQLQLGIPAVQTGKLPQKFSENQLENFIAQHRLIFIESPPESGKSHTAEAKRVSRLLQALSHLYGKEFLPSKSVGVITPWRAQINAIMMHVKQKKKMELISVDTVERFQGSERDTIILSMATSEPVYLQALQSLNKSEFDIEVDRKLNVAISRAENRLIILGESWVLSKSKHYARLINKIKQAGGYIEPHKAIKLFDESPSTEEPTISF